MQTYTVTTPVSAVLIAELMTAAFEGGIDYWCAGVEPIEGPHKDAQGDYWYVNPEFWWSDFRVRFHVRETDETYDLTPDTLRQGIQKSHVQMTFVVAEQEVNPSDADHVLQMALFGRLRFG